MHYSMQLDMLYLALQQSGFSGTVPRPRYIYADPAR